MRNHFYAIFTVILFNLPLLAETVDTNTFSFESLLQSVTKTSLPIKVPGRHGNALSFDGRDDVMQLRKAITLPIEFTIQFWFSPGNLSAKQTI